MQIAIGADHGGFPLKEELIQLIRAAGHDVNDLGACEYNAADDYPDFALAVARAVVAGEAGRGIVICGSGVGASVAANKVRGARAALCHDSYSARQGVEHDDLNVLCLGARVIGVEVAREVVRSYLGAQFTQEERHQRRLSKILAAENE
jgi:ribose 5-phosphate isomerase B